MHARRQSAHQGKQSGFAVILALSLMAFVLLLLMSMTLLVQVETSSSSTALAQLRAKEAARLALYMALGDLQRYAGPDQRVTARAEILGTARTSENPFWTGVWDTTDTAAGPRWLVSWQEQTGTPVNTMQLVGPGTVGSDPAQYVDAPIIGITGSSGATETEIAWWISDEGVKASVGTLPLNLRDDPNFLEAPSVDALELQIASSHGLEELFEDYDRFDTAQPDDARALERIDSIEQLLSIGDFSGTNDFSGETPFHALTPGSFGVLASTIDDPDGGLMRDLSLYPELLGSGVAEYLSLGEQHAAEQALAAGSTDGLRLKKRIEGLNSLPALNDGEVFNPMAPILSNFMVAFTIRSQSPTSSNPNFYLRMRFFCEFWNPFTHSVSMKTAAGDELELELEISGLPEVTLTKTTGTISSSAPINIQNLLADPSNADGAMVIRLRYDQSEDWLPGRAKNWTGVDASTATGASPYTSIRDDGKDWNNSLYNLGGSTGIDTGIPRLSGDVRHTSTGNDQIDIRVYLVNKNTGSRDLMSEYLGIEYEPVSTRPSGYSSTHSGTTFGYHVVLRGPHFSTLDPEYYRGLWLFDNDPRNPALSFNSDWYLDNDPTALTGSPYAPVKDGISPLSLPIPSEINEINDTINTVVFRRPMDRSSGSSGNLYNVLWQDAPLFELPRERVLSIASLQHIYIHNERPFQVGNSWARNGDKNELEWFDRYFFSGLSRSDNAADYDDTTGLPNPSLLGYNFTSQATLIQSWQNQSAVDEAASRKPAEKLMVANRFNLNSTSLAAWKSVLGSLRLGDLDYLDYPEDDTSNLSTLSLSNASREGTFARYSHSLEETYEAPETPKTVQNGGTTEPVAPSAYYRHGARRLDGDQLESFATEIVSLLKQRGRPFPSMEEFLSVKNLGLPGETNDSLLEEAIRNVFGTGSGGRQQWFHSWETTGVRDSNETPVEIDHFSPGFLTQADVMTAIGPMLSPRSDTFRIRARGESFGPQGASASAATIEATFQRTPRPIDPAIDPAVPTDRKFELLAIRWLNNDEI